VPLVLGIHHGHNASCAIVRDGVLIAAIQQERITRIKNDGQESLSNRLPLHACLGAAGARLQDVTTIVSSFQAASPGGIGLHRPLVEPDFDLFDPWDHRHLVVSHHYAHALSAIGTSQFREAAVLICDLAGSTTRDGLDFVCTFEAFEQVITSLNSQPELRTECLSIYEADGLSLDLKHREYCVPHNAPDVFIQNAASLYDNVARMIFNKENAHGQLMALASMGQTQENLFDVTDLVTVASDGTVSYRNDWQHRVSRYKDVLDYAPLAHCVQKALQCALLHYIRKTRMLTSSCNLAAAGGVFLNILGNSEISHSGVFNRFYVPSSPHDAGISIGCAYAGWHEIAPRCKRINGRKATDRLGPNYSRDNSDDCLRNSSLETNATERWGPDREFRTAVTPCAIARLLHEGKIIARCAGRSEFGPRALGGRSLLGSPLISDTKARLNAIKGRQSWRPVAPIVRRERVEDFFRGPEDSPYMNFVHEVREQYRSDLVALSHPDCSTRAQTLERSDDRDLYEILVAFEQLTGFPILVNTSLNGPGEPIAETPQDAVEFFISHPDVDAMLLAERLILRPAPPSWRDARIAPDTIVSIVYPRGNKRIILVRRDASLEISQDALNLIESQPKRTGIEKSASEIESELKEALRRGLLVRA
jgi:carbamoyltransferase